VGMGALQPERLRSTAECSCNAVTNTWRWI
jgi:hypothetical protein